MRRNEQTSTTVYIRSVNQHTNGRTAWMLKQTQPITHTQYVKTIDMPKTNQPTTQPLFEHVRLYRLKSTVDCCKGHSVMTSFGCPSGCGLRARRDGSCSAVTCPSYRPSRRGTWQNQDKEALRPKRPLSIGGSPSFKEVSRRIRASMSTVAASTPACMATVMSPGPSSAVVASAAAEHDPATADVKAPETPPVVRPRAIAVAAVPGNSRARLRSAVLARHSALCAAVGEPMAFHVMGACLSAVEKSPLNARLEPLSVWASAVLHIGWDLMGSGEAPCHLWRSSEPHLVQESTIAVVMNWVGGCSISLPLCDHLLQQ